MGSAGVPMPLVGPQPQIPALRWTSTPSRLTAIDHSVWGRLWPVSHTLLRQLRPMTHYKREASAATIAVVLAA